MKRKSRNEIQSAGWLTTFNDLVTLLLTFFVLVLSMSKLDSGKVQQASRSVCDAFGMLNWSEGRSIRIFKPFVMSHRLKILSTEAQKRALAEELNDIDGLTATIVEEGLLVIMGDKVLFKTGLAELEPEKYSKLKRLGTIIRDVDCSLRIEGHTDNVPIHTARYSSNWELSAARAVAVVKYFISECGIAPERLSAAGYADSKPRWPNDTALHRAKNRRVEVTLATQT